MISSAITQPGGDAPVSGEWLGVPTSGDVVPALRTALAWMWAGRTRVDAANRLWSVQGRIFVHQARRDEVAAIRDVVTVLRTLRGRVT